MTNPKINLVSLRQSLSGQFASLTFRNGERDDFRSPFHELSGSQKRSYITLGTDLASMELTIRLDNKTSQKQLIMDLDKFKILVQGTEGFASMIGDHCVDCDGYSTKVFLKFDFEHKLFDFSVHCDNHIPTPEE